MVKASNAYYHYGFGEMGMSIAFNQVSNYVIDPLNLLIMYLYYSKFNGWDWGK